MISYSESYFKLLVSAVAGNTINNITSTLKSFKSHKTINYLLYIISIMPFSMQKLMLVGRRKLMDIKKIIKK
jgi:hypothetical protein